MDSAALGTAKAGRNVRLDLMRIVFATMVIWSHAYIIQDKDVRHEPFARITGSWTTVGDLAVDGFFLLSGYLIVKSWQSGPSLGRFLRNRVLRIYPGYLVAVAVSVVGMGLLAPAVPQYFRHVGMGLVGSVFWLTMPDAPAVCPGTMPVFHTVNGSLWTIAYEFRCYLLVALVGATGLLRRRTFWAALTMVGMVLFLSYGQMRHIQLGRLLMLVGDFNDNLRLVPVFLIGGCFYLFRDEIRFRPVLAGAAVVGMVLADFVVPSRLELCMVVFGGYLMFYLGSLERLELRWMRRVPDVSYGIYLYGWPVEMLWTYFRKSSPGVTFLASAVICVGLGWVSWEIVERPMLRLKGGGRLGDIERHGR